MCSLHSLSTIQGHNAGPQLKGCSHCLQFRGAMQAVNSRGVLTAINSGVHPLLSHMGSSHRNPYSYKANFLEQERCSLLPPHSILNYLGERVAFRCTKRKPVTKPPTFSYRDDPSYTVRTPHASPLMFCCRTALAYTPNVLAPGYTPNVLL